MRLTKGTDYGARGAIYLAKLPPSAVALVGDIADAEGVPESYLAKILQSLAKEGIVHSHRGAKGGFSLARPACEITLRQVVEAIEGPVALCRCLAPWDDCERKGHCAMRPVMARVQQGLIEALEHTTLQELADNEGIDLSRLGALGSASCDAPPKAFT